MKKLELKKIRKCFPFNYQQYGSNRAIYGVTNDSRKAKKEYLYVAIKGLNTDGHLYIDEAIKKGASVIVGTRNPKYEWLKKATYLKVKNPRRVLSYFASILYSDPSQKMICIGVTGTDGKTTTSNMIYQILRSAGKKVGVISTVGAIINDKKYETGLHVSSPEPLDLHRLLNKMAQQKCEYAILEVTSHGLEQERFFGVNFLCSILTNISPEHLDYHKDMDKYYKAKSKLFKNSKVSFLNKDHSSYKIMFNLINKYTKVEFYSKSKVSNKLKNVLNKFIFNDYNKQNMAAALKVTSKLGILEEKQIMAVKNVELPEGRMQKINNNLGIKIYIDFAHTPNAVEKLLKDIKKVVKEKIIVVVSAEGERDPGKRYKIPKVATKYAHLTILNPIDPRSEEPEVILGDMEKGAVDGGAKKVNNKRSKIKLTKSSKFYTKIINRSDAINLAIKSAYNGDTILILGKGHEKSMAVNGKEIAWSDKKVVEKFIGQKEKST